jgi:hypothetical protein
MATVTAMAVLAMASMGPKNIIISSDLAVPLGLRSGPRQELVPANRDYRMRGAVVTAPWVEHAVFNHVPSTRWPQSWANGDSARSLHGTCGA